MCFLSVIGLHPMSVFNVINDHVNCNIFKSVKFVVNQQPKFGSINNISGIMWDKT